MRKPGAYACFSWLFVVAILWLLVSPFQSNGVRAQGQLPVEELAFFQSNSRQEAPAGRLAQRPKADSRKSKTKLPSQAYPSVFVDQRVRLSLPALDMAKIRQEDEAAKGKLHQSSRVGISRAAAMSTAKDGRWINLGPDGRAWVLSVTSQGAIAVRVHLAKFSLPRGARLFLYAPSADPQIETFEDRGPFGDGDFWSPSIPGDTVILEMLDPSSSSDTEQPNFFEIVKIGHIYRDRAGRGPLEPVVAAASSGSQPELETCHLDATCYSEWSSTGDAVAHILFVENGGLFICSGTLLNSIADDSSPLFLTANHCVSNETVARTVEAFWFYETSSCNGIPPFPSNSLRSVGSRFLAGRTITELSDFTLLEILGTLPTKGGFYPYWAGWTTANPPLFASVTGIHHPDGSFRRISFGSIQFNLTDPNYHIVRWSSGITEGGSSGSALFNSSQQVVGQLYAGRIGFSCANPTGENAYGQLSKSYPAIVNPQGQNYLQVGLGDDSLEPNDTRATARTVGLASLANLVVKSYGNNLGEDWHRISVPANYRVVAEARFTNSWGDIDLELYRGSESIPVASSVSDLDIERITFQNGPTATDYLVRVFLFDDVRNTYNLSIDLTLPPPTNITITTSPLGRQIIVDGLTYTSPQNFIWTTGSSHTIGVPSPQSGGSGAQYAFSSWSDGGGVTHTITVPSTSTAYTASFTTQYLLTTAVNPVGTGSVNPNCSGGGCWYNIGATVNLQATTNTGYSFSSWSGAVTGTANPASLAMNAPKSVTANFMFGRVINPGGIRNNANYALTVAPGAIVAIFGSRLTDGTSCLPPSCNPTFGSTGRLNTTMAGAQVSVNGTPVPIFYAVPGQLGVQIPTELNGSSATVQVSVGGQSSPAVSVQMEPVSPGIFTFTADGRGAGAFTHADGSPVAPQNPARPGEVVILYGTGLGQVSPPVATGTLPGGESRAVASVTVSIDGISVIPDFAGLAGCCVGLNQINVRVPESARTANDIPVVLSVGGKQSNTVTIAVQ